MVDRRCGSEALQQVERAHIRTMVKARRQASKQAHVPKSELRSLAVKHGQGCPSKGHAHDGIQYDSNGHMVRCSLGYGHRPLLVCIHTPHQMQGALDWRCEC